MTADAYSNQRPWGIPGRMRPGEKPRVDCRSTASSGPRNNVSCLCISCMKASSCTHPASNHNEEVMSMTIRPDELLQADLLSEVLILGSWVLIAMALLMIILAACGTVVGHP